MPVLWLLVAIILIGFGIFLLGFAEKVGTFFEKQVINKIKDLFN